MSDYYGDIRLGDTRDVKFSTTVAGVPTTLAGSPVVSAYVGNGTTEITAGITLTVDFDSRTGMHNVRVVASSGNGYATATDVELVITTGTVGGTSVVGMSIGSFSIENRSAVMPTTAARTLDVSSTGEAGVDWANVGSPTTTLALTGTSVTLTSGERTSIGTALLDLANGVETGWTLRQVLRIIAATLGGKSTGAVAGASGSPVYRDITDTKARVSATTDASGNRSAITLDAT